MKIGIVGNYGNDNNGDEAILFSIILQLERTFNISREDISVFSNNPGQTSARYGVHSYPLYYKSNNIYRTFYHTFQKNKKRVARLDLLIIGGGGILMDFYRREAHLYGSYAMMAKLSKVPFIIYGCGAGPINTVIGRFLIRRMCRHASNVSVRDPESKKLLNDIGVKKEIHVIGDPALALYQPREEYNESPKEVAVSCVPMYNKNYWPYGDVDKYEEYVSGMARNLDRLIEKEDVNITFFATKYPQDVCVTKDIQEKMRHRKRTKIIDENLQPQKLLEFESRFDTIIGTRLHSLIVATCSATPIVGIAYHPKVANFMKLIGVEDRCLTIGDIQEDEMALARTFSHLRKNWKDIVHDTKSIAQKVCEEATNKGRELLMKAVEENGKSIRD